MKAPPWSPFREVIRYDPNLSRVGTWRLSARPEDDGEIEVRLRLALGPEVQLGIFLRHHRSAEESPLRVFIQQIDDSTFATESTVLHRAVPRVALQLNDAPADVALVLRSL